MSDVCQSSSVQLKNNTLYCFFENSSCFKRSYKTDKLEIFLDDKERVVGFAVCDLSGEQIDMVKKLIANEEILHE